MLDDYKYTGFALVEAMNVKINPINKLVPEVGSKGKPHAIQIIEPYVNFMGSSHISILHFRLIALCGHSEKQTMQFGSRLLLILTKLVFVCFPDLNCGHISLI